MALAVPQGPVQVMVNWSTTKDVIAGRWLSALALALLVWVWWLERRLDDRRFAAQPGRAA
jgi:hypothetical protein